MGTPHSLTRSIYGGDANPSSHLNCTMAASDSCVIRGKSTRGKSTKPCFAALTMKSRLHTLSQSRGAICQCYPKHHSQRSLAWLLLMTTLLGDMYRYPYITMHSYNVTATSGQHASPSSPPHCSQVARTSPLYTGSSMGIKGLITSMPNQLCGSKTVAGIMIAPPGWLIDVAAHVVG